MAGAKVEQLIDLDIDKIKALTSPDAIRVYEADVKVDLLIDLDIDKIEVLVSYEALCVYWAGVKVDLLINLDIDKIKALISYEVLSVYEVGVQVDQLINLDTDQIEVLISIVDSPQNQSCTDSELKELLTDKIKVLTSPISEEYDSGIYSDPSDLQDTDSLKPSEANIDYEVELTGQ